MGAKIKTPKKIPGPKLNPKNFLTKFSSLKIFQKALNDIIITFYFIWLYFIRRITQPTIFRLFRIPPKIPSQIMPPKKITCQIFLPQKIPESKISSPKKSFSYPYHSKSGVPPNPPRVPTLRLGLGKFGCFQSAVTYGKWSLTKGDCMWRFDCISTVWEMSLCSSSQSCINYLILTQSAQLPLDNKVSRSLRPK